MPRKPNILLLMTDQQRWDAMGCAGNPVIRTPNMDGLARDGARFATAYTCTPSCTPARAALLTGMGPWKNGMLGYSTVLENYPVELPALLGDAGYRTFGIGKMHWHPQKTLHGFRGTLVDESGRVESPGFVSDYRRWFAREAPGLDPDATGIGWNDFDAKPYALPEKLHPTVWTADTAVKWLEEYDDGEPFFLKVSFARPHSPCDPPKRYWDMYREEDMPTPVVGDWAGRYAAVSDPPPPDTWRGDLGLAQARKSRRGYYGSITFIDDQVGRVLQTLRARGMYDDTLILFCSDHGDMLGDHNLWRKTYAWEGSARIPMILRWPSWMLETVERGSTLDHPVELRDILPTFLDAAGAPVPEAVDGDSMLRLVRGDDEGWREWIDLEHSQCYQKNDHWTGLVGRRWKYVYRGWDGEEFLFDLLHDPGELRNLAGDPSHAETLALWRGRMADHLAERGEEWVRNGQLVKGRRNRVHSPNYGSLEAVGTS